MDAVEDRVRATTRLSVHICVDFVIHLKVKLGKEDENAIATAVVSTARKTVVKTETEEGETKDGDVVDLADGHLLTPHVDSNNSKLAMGTLLLLASVTYWLYTRWWETKAS